MSSSITLESLTFPGIVDRDGRRRRFVTETSAAPWAKHLRPGDRIETAGPDRATVAVVVEEVCVHSGGHAGLDRCLKHPMREYDLRDSHLFEVLGGAFVALQVEPEEIRSERSSEMTVVVYRVDRSAPAA
ncbi:hypothetical protein [Glycomyces sp. NPDC048151]|uniref:hypothetical protein n=1 Tax=Glycomyces sp. NPDC048151 TaxID=3364002 RepID=UPI00371C12B8